MLKIENILITTDYSDAAAPALARGMDLAKQFGAKAHLVNVVLMAEAAPVYPLYGMASDTKKIFEALNEESQQRMAELTEGLGDHGVELTSQVAHGSYAAPRILEYAKEHDVDLIVIGTHGRRGLRRYLLGSVAEEVVRKAPCPVLSCHPEGSTELTRPQRLLVAVDLSEHSEALVRQAHELATTYHAVVDYLHVIPEWHQPLAYTPDVCVAPYPDLQRLEDNSMTALKELVLRHHGDAGDCEYLVRHGSPPSTIVEVAEERSADLIALASHGLTGAKYLLLGSVADHVVRSSKVPVLTFHSGGKNWLADDESAGSGGNEQLVAQ